MGQQSSSQASSSLSSSSKPKARKSTFSKLKSAAIASAQGGTGREELRLTKQRRQSFPFSEQEFDSRHGVLTRMPTPPPVEEEALPHRMDSLLPVSSSRATTVASNNSAPIILHVINWEHLPEPVLSNRGVSNVWSGGSGMFDIEDDTATLDMIAAMFARQAPKLAPNLTASSAIKKVSVLDPRRTIKISLAMKRMGLEVKKFPKLIWALKDCNESYLTSDAVEILFEAQVWATPSEAHELKTKIRLDGGEELLANEDLLLWYLVKSVPDCGERITALSFRFDFDAQLNITLQSMAILRSACAEICSSQLLKRLLRVVLFVGNSINNQAASGIALSSLMHLNDYKSPVKSGVSFLDCVVAYLDVCAPEAFEVSDELMLIEKAACDIAPLLTQQASLVELKRELGKKVKPIRGLTDFYNQALERLQKAEIELQDTKQSFTRCLEYFCLNSTTGSIDNVEFFGTMFEFLEDFNDAIGRLQTKQEQERRKQMDEAAKRKRNIPAPIVPPPVFSGLQNPDYMSLRRASVSQHQNSLVYSNVAQRAPSSRLSVFGRVKSVNIRPLSIGFSPISEDGEKSPRALGNRPKSGRGRPISMMMTMSNLEQSTELNEQNGGVIQEEEEEEEL
ncbi:hypothetical protein BASA81_001971 [Batrachochytrium salamandrivorans]|nr:hypothetical protein BASA81_001971 [Batrachochytrium salamandrivorans]